MDVDETVLNNRSIPNLSAQLQSSCDFEILEHTMQEWEKKRTKDIFSELGSVSHMPESGDIYAQRKHYNVSESDLKSLQPCNFPSRQVFPFSFCFPS